MTMAFLFWLLMLLWLIFGFYWNWPKDRTNPAGFGILGGNLMLFILLFLLGCQTFGWPIR